jgi:autotransporter translocation and assembly factor TamB
MPRPGDLAIRFAEPAHLRFDGEAVHVDRLEMNAGGTHLSASGFLPLMTGSGNLTVLVTGDIGDATRAVAATGLADVSVISAASGPINVRAQVAGTAEKPVLAGDASVGPGSVSLKNLSTATNVNLRARVENDVVSVLDSGFEYEGAMARFTGAVPLSVLGVANAARTAQPASLHATVTGITPAVLRGLADPATLEDLAGTIDVAVNVDAPSTDLTRASGDLTLTRLDLQLGGLPVMQRVPTRLTVNDGFARIESWNWTGTGGTLAVFGQVRLADRQAALIANGDIDLRILTPFVRSAGVATAGRLTPRISITGPLDAPRIDGDVALDSGEVRLLDPRIIVNGLTARAALTRTALTLRALDGTINGGSLTGGGTVSYDPDAGLSARLTTDITQMALDFPAGLRSELNASLQLDATAAPNDAAPSARLSGNVTVLRGAYREPLAVVGGLLAAARARRLAATGGAAEEDQAFLRNLALDIRLVTDEDIIVDNNYARAQLGGDLNIIGTAAAPALSGRAQLREDGQLFIGRNVYTISRDIPSTIDFVSPTTIEPELNIHLETRVAGHDIQLALTGSAESPAVDMTSEDLGPADITALLLTGRELDDLGNADAAFIGTQVIGNFSGEVLGFAGRAVGLDTLRLGGVEDVTTRRDASAAATEVDPTSRLTFGKSLGPDVDVTFSQSLRDSTAQTWIVDYLPARQLDVRYVLNDDDLASYGFRHDVSFGGGTAASTARGTSERRVEPRVAAVSITGDLAFPEQRVRALLKLRQGDRFDFGRWQEDRDRLEDFYHANGRLAARISSMRAGSGDTFNLSYAIDAGPQTRIEIAPDLGSDVTQRIAAAWTISVLDELLVDEATQTVKAELLRRGYVKPVVSSRLTMAGDVKTLHIDVQPGERSSMARVRIQAADTSVADDLEAHLRLQNLEEQVLTDPGAITRYLTDYLRSHGYLRASVKAAPPLYEEGVAILPISVDPGQQFVLATIRFEVAPTFLKTILRACSTRQPARRTTRRRSTPHAGGW